jgi:hypothetical protein
MSFSPPDDNSRLARMAPWWGRISLLWLMCVPLCVVIYSLCLPISPNDFWYHARAGSITATTGHVPTTNLFSYGWWNGISVPPETPYYNQGWIAHWAFYKVLEIGGLAWIEMLRSACMGAAYALITWAALRRARRVAESQLTGQETAAQLLELENGIARVAALGALLTFLMSALNMDVRPQTFSFPLFALFSFAVYEWPFNEKARPFLMALLGAALALWANVHGAFLTALIASWMLVVGESLHGLRPVPVLGAPASRKSLLRLGLTAIACTCAAMMNPRGPGIFTYAVKLAGNTINERFIQEWKHPWFDEWNSDLFFFAPFLLAFLLWKSAKRANNDAAQDSVAPCGVRAGELLALLALLAMGLRNVRAIIWFALFFAPAFSGAFMAAVVNAKLKMKLQKAPPEPPRAVYVANAVMAVLLLFLIVPALPWVKPEIPLPPAFHARFAPNPKGTFPVGFSGDPPLLLENSTPVESAEFLRKSPPRGRLYNEMVYGSYLMWALYPRTRPNGDPRIELYPEQYWLDYLDFQSHPQNAGEILAREGYTDALLNPELQKPLIRELSRAPGWRKYSFKHDKALLFRHETTG